MVARLNPLGNAEKTQEVARTKQTARRNSIDDVSSCVECGKLMRLLECNGIMCYVCLDHRVCLPVKDS